MASRADEFIARVAKLAGELGVTFVLAVHDAPMNKAKFMASFGAIGMLKPFLLKQLGIVEKKPDDEEITEVSWDDR